MLKTRTPVYLLEIDLEFYPSFLERSLVILLSSHVLKCWGSINVMELLGLVDNCLYVRTLEKSDLSDHNLPFFLLFSQVVMCNVSYSFKTSRKMHIICLLWLCDFCKPVDNLLIVKILIGELLFNALQTILSSIFEGLLNLIFNFCIFEQNHLFVLFELNNSGKTVNSKWLTWEDQQWGPFVWEVYSLH